MEALPCVDIIISFTFPAGHLINSLVLKKVNALIEYKNLLSKQQINSIN